MRHSTEHNSDGVISSRSCVLGMFFDVLLSLCRVGSVKTPS